LLAFGGYLFYLDRYLSARLSDLQWKEPILIYSDNTVLKKGGEYSPSLLEKKLQRLKYRKLHPAMRLHPGSYHAEDGNYLIDARPFPDRDGKVKDATAKISYAGSTIREILLLPDGGELATFTLEPEFIGEIQEGERESRILVQLSSLPPQLLHAVLSMEDQRYLEHKGLDPKGILRALFKDLMHLSFVEGGSTITQQLIRSTFLTSRKTLWRKFNEMLLAILLERKYDKEEILEMYFNEVYMGQRGAEEIHGVAAASDYYFGKTPDKLSLAECATLAAIIPGPNYYSPHRQPQRVIERKKLVLEKMRSLALITEQEYALAVEEPLNVVPKTSAERIAPYFVDAIREQLREMKLLKAGNIVYSTLDADLQRLANMAVSRGVTFLEQSYKHLSSEEDPLQSAMLVVTPSSGEIRAMVGGRSYNATQYNRALQARRQPGSLFKPVVFLSALSSRREDGKAFTLSTPLEDAPFKLQFGKQTWEPENYDEQFRGIVTLRTALEQSINIPTARLAMEVGLQRIKQMAHQLGFVSEIPLYPSVALGSMEATMKEVTQAYSTLANFGTRIPLYSIRFITNGEGRTLYRAREESYEVISPEVTALLVHGLIGVVNNGTGAAARGYGFNRTAAGKTGTTNDFKDAWFAGFTPDLLAVTWVGFDRGKSLKLTGAGAAIPIWANFMKSASVYFAEKGFTFPENLVKEEIDRETGFLAAPDCQNIFTEWYLPGTEPTEYCATHNPQYAAEHSKSTKGGVLNFFKRWF
ncbi:MAG: PBP1A family penicillin-binding protein, partial [Deltaproteobacteria bacterium]|nr:PBP1A family penicillin-binding protein [Deltaproteobacteria bacterium]